MPHIPIHTVIYGVTNFQQPGSTLCQRLSLTKYHETWLTKFSSVLWCSVGQLCSKWGFNKHSILLQRNEWGETAAPHQTRTTESCSKREKKQRSFFQTRSLVLQLLPQISLFTFVWECFSYQCSPIFSLLFGPGIQRLFCLYLFPSSFSLLHSHASSLQGFASQDF